MRKIIGNYLVNVGIKKMIPHMKGVGSITQDALHVMFFDFDQANTWEIQKVVKPIQIRYDLHDCLILESSPNNYHGIINSKLTFGSIIDIHQDMENYDPAHDMHSVKRGYWVHRITDKEGHKIKYVTTLKHKPTKKVWKRSNAHRILMNKLYNLRLPKTPEHDNFEHLCFDDYPTIRKSKKDKKGK